jgi:hypothetical protein
VHVASHVPEAALPAASGRRAAAAPPRERASGERAPEVARPMRSREVLVAASLRRSALKARRSTCSAPPAEEALTHADLVEERAKLSYEGYKRGMVLGWLGVRWPRDQAGEQRRIKRQPL